MDAMKLGEPGGFWDSPAYSVKVRGLRYLWGSAGITQNLTFEKPLILHVANDRAGEPITIGTQVAAGAKTALGTLQPGEYLSLSVNDISGVYADCALDSIVHCLVH
ncbi:hypothetical protein GCM10018953_66900 [Streptosporangium nondiastaticum]